MIKIIYTLKGSIFTKTLQKADGVVIIDVVFKYNIKVKSFDIRNFLIIGKYISHMKHCFKSHFN